VVPETIARFIGSGRYANLSVKPVTALTHTFEPGRTRPRCGAASSRPTGSCRCRALPAARPTAPSPKSTTWNGSRPATRCSRRCAGTMTRPRSLRPGRVLLLAATRRPGAHRLYRAKVVDGLGRSRTSGCCGRAARGRRAAPVSSPRWATTTVRRPGPRRRLPPGRAPGSTNKCCARLEDVRGERQPRLSASPCVELSLTELCRRPTRSGRAAAEIDGRARCRGRWRRPRRHAD
jgi:hypothetical protein